jgi:hypothetical protein
LILFLTLRGSPGSAAAVALTPWWCLACGPVSGADLFQNLLLFLPLGLVMGMAGWHWGRSALILAAIPVAIEVSQALLQNGRDAALGDVIANAAGGLVGWWLGSGALSRLVRWPHLAPATVAVFCVQLALTALLGRPAAAGPEPWQLRLNPATGHRLTYAGEVRQVLLGDVALSDEAPLPSPIRVRGANGFSATFTWDTTGGSDLTPILRLDDGRGWEILSLDRRDDAIGMTLRTRAGLLRFRNPVLRVPVGEVEPGEPLTGELSLGRGEIRAELTGAYTAALSLRWGAQHGWVFINPFTPVHHSGETWEWWTLGWLLGWGVVIALASGYATQRWLWLVLSLGGLWLTTQLAGAGATSEERIALALGWMLVELSRIALRRRPAAA